MSLVISEAAGLASILAIRGQFEGDGPDSPMLTIWSGEPPDEIDDDVDDETNLILADFTLIGTVFGDPAREDNALVCDLLPVGGVMGADEGQASFFRMYDRNGETVLQGSVGLADSGADLVIDDIDITPLKLVTVQSLRLALPLSAP